MPVHEIDLKKINCNKNSKSAKDYKITHFFQ